MLDRDELDEGRDPNKEKRCLLKRGEMSEARGGL